MPKATQITGGRLDEDAGLSKIRGHNPHLGDAVIIETNRLAIRRHSSKYRLYHSPWHNTEQNWQRVVSCSFSFPPGKELGQYFSGVSVHVFYLGDQRNAHMHTHLPHNAMLGIL